MTPAPRVDALVGRRTAITVGAWAAGIWLLWRLPGPAEPPAPGPHAAAPGGPAEPPAPTRLSVVIPARNEERALPALLGSLAAQTDPADEVVVIDDHSVDDTVVVAAARQG